MTRTMPALRRVVVAMEAMGDPDRIIEAATQLARVLHAEIAGLFVQEDALLDLSGLPFARALTAASSETVAITPDMMRRALAREARMRGRTLVASARRADVKCSFGVAQGSLRATLAASAGRGDVVAIDLSNWGQAAWRAFGELRETSRAASAIMLTTGGGILRAGPVLAIDDGDLAGEATVRLAAMLAQALDRRLWVLAVAADSRTEDSILARARAIAAELAVDVRTDVARTAEDAMDHVTAAHAGFVVADLEGMPFCDDEAARALVRGAGAPVLLLRRSDQAPPRGAPAGRRDSAPDRGTGRPSRRSAFRAGRP